MKKLLYIILCCITVSKSFSQISIIQQAGIDASSMKVVNGKFVYYHEGSMQWAYELYATDGTPSGTYMVKDINPNSSDELFCWNTASGAGGMKYENYVYQDRLYFYADDGVHGMELWTSDATTAGTNMFYEFNPGMMGWDFTDNKVPAFCEMGGMLYMNAGNTANGNELWISDGTAAGTHQLIDLNPGAPGSNPSFLISYNGKMFFTATDGTHGWELYCTDGTAQGTQLVKDMIPGIHGIFDEGAGLVSINPYFTISGGLLYFQGDDVGGIGPSQRHWWRTDGTAAGTFRIETTLYPYDEAGTDYNGQFYFGSYIASTGPELWKSNGTVSGTTQILMNNGLLVWSSMMSVGNYIYFIGMDNDSSGISLTDGTTAGTSMVFGFDEGSVYPNHFAVHNGHMFFSLGRWDDNLMAVRDRLVQSNGTQSGTIIYPKAQPRSKVIPYGNDYIFYGTDTIEIFHTPFTTYLFKLTPANIPPGVGVGVSEIKNSKTISCYPNPSSDHITISSDEFDLRSASLSIVDVTGKIVYCKKLGDDNFSFVKLEIPASISNGFYIIEIKNSHQRISDRLVIQRN